LICSAVIHNDVASNPAAFALVLRPPKAKATGSSPVGCANLHNNLAAFGPDHDRGHGAPKVRITFAARSPPPAPVSHVQTEPKFKGAKQ
jgi:hypothetical protein